MDTNTPALDLGDLRATDSNSLLRLYDLATAIVARSPRRQDRARAGKAVQRIDLDRFALTFSYDHRIRVIRGG